MTDRISQTMGVSHEALDQAGVFDRYVDIDSRLHVDPHLLATSSAPEVAAAADTLRRYWQQMIVVVRNIIEHGDRIWREAVQRFTFPENTSIGLGYSNRGTAGLAVGRQTAEGLVETARDIIRAGITDPEIFELVGLFEPRIGPDIISDITVHIIESHLLQYTQRVCADLGVLTESKTVGDSTYQLPINPQSRAHLILLPKDILRDLPVAFDWQDIDRVCIYNDALRARLNALIGDNWRRAVHDHKKEKLKQTLIDNPEALSDMIQQYRSKPAEPYDFSKDLLGETIWLEQARRAASDFPLDLRKYGPVPPELIAVVVRDICAQFRRLVEECGLSRLFWADSGQVRHERFPQLLFFGIADSYCKANNIDLSPEVNSGRGPVDFKLSTGYDSRVLVEVKWSKNTKLVHGYRTQLDEYAKAEQARTTFFLIIRVTDSMTSIEKAQALQAKAIRERQRAPEILIIDGRIKDSASHFED